MGVKTRPDDEYYWPVFMDINGHVSAFDGDNEMLDVLFDSNDCPIAVSSTTEKYFMGYKQVNESYYYANSTDNFVLKKLNIVNVIADIENLGIYFIGYYTIHNPEPGVAISKTLVSTKPKEKEEEVIMGTGFDLSKYNFEDAEFLGNITEGLDVTIPPGYVIKTNMGIKITEDGGYRFVYVNTNNNTLHTFDDDGGIFNVALDKNGAPIVKDADGNLHDGYKDVNGTIVYSKVSKMNYDFTVTINITIVIEEIKALSRMHPSYYTIFRTDEVPFPKREDNDDDFIESDSTGTILVDSEYAIIPSCFCKMEPDEEMYFPCVVTKENNAKCYTSAGDKPDLVFDSQEAPLTVVGDAKLPGFIIINEVEIYGNLTSIHKSKIFDYKQYNDIPIIEPEEIKSESPNATDEESTNMEEPAEEDGIPDEYEDDDTPPPTEDQFFDNLLVD
uniref:IgGFc_binding domain-containing protein n=1 Tax=Rhabditophanes sp. KR3021 TaxID=114890 RepID=A0AC35TJV5_9BILA